MEEEHSHHHVPVFEMCVYHYAIYLLICVCVSVAVFSTPQES